MILTSLTSTTQGRISQLWTHPFTTHPCVIKGPVTVFMIWKGNLTWLKYANVIILKKVYSSEDVSGSSYSNLIIRKNNSNNCITNFSASLCDNSCNVSSGRLNMHTENNQPNQNYSQSPPSVTGGQSQKYVETLCFITSAMQPQFCLNVEFIQTSMCVSQHAWSWSVSSDLTDK